MSARGLLVTGTDTGVGKTLITAGLVAAFRARGVPARPLKPVESGTAETDGVPADAALLALCAGLPDFSYANVVALDEPLAPMVAAARQGVTLEMITLDEAIANISPDEYLVVEGCGGALVEIAPGVTVADLPARWHLPALVVAANRLGVLSHTLLTVEALQARGAQIAGVVLNTMHSGPPTLAEQTNEEELLRLLPDDVTLLPSIPWVPESMRASPIDLAAAVGILADWLLPPRASSPHDLASKG